MNEVRKDEFNGYEYPLGIQPICQEFSIIKTGQGERRVTGKMVVTTFTPSYPPDLTEEEIILGGG
jgi:hypothetical protein